MSLATRCTHCGTIFKVVQDQLKVSEGWVRCGRCQAVFNAIPALFDLDTQAPPPRTGTNPAPQAAAPQTTAPAAPVVSPPPPAPAPAPRPMVAAATEATHSSPFVERPDPASASPDSPEATWPAAAASALPAATDFDLDLDTDTDVPVSTPAWAPEPPVREAELPSTGESDAIDSRHLIPAIREHKQTRKRERGPEFADAQFPTDAQLDAEEDWASDFGTLPPDTLPPEPASTFTSTPSPVSPAGAPTPLPTAATGATAKPLPLGRLAQHDPDEPADSHPTTLPSRFADSFVPELPVEPPHLRKGKPGTRGRDPAQHTPEFVKRAQRQAFWRHPAMRALLGLLLLGLSLGLGLQMTHQFRDLLAAYHPEARPLLSQWCALAGCQIRPPLRLDSLQVESATLVRASSEGPDHYRLAVVVHNRAPIDLAWPHIDLTLTDENGAIVARRVFSAADAQWLDTAEPKAEAPSASTPPAGQTLPAAAPSQRSTTLQWRLRATDLRPASYTAELFYP